MTVPEVRPTQRIGLPLGIPSGPETAVVTDTQRVSFSELAERVGTAGARLGRGRRLVMLRAGNDLNSLVWYLAALSTGNPIILVQDGDPRRYAEIQAEYDPDTLVAANRDQPVFVREDSSHDLHPDLALLLSTSGSTGSPKMVRLSRGNLTSNALAIAKSLSIRPTDCAITSLPMSYSYGLSVINSHLVLGASVSLTDLSVVDACFWSRFERDGCTSLAGVPYTFDLIERSGFDSLEYPNLRIVTCAGGALAPERVRAYAEAGRACGWDFFVMYGQTEATARMAVLPAELALEKPDHVGFPIDGGNFRLDAPVGSGGPNDTAMPEGRQGPRPADPGPEVAGDTGPPGVTGELIYEGPNVMMGYAVSAADLSRGNELKSLRTGDLARQSPDGAYAIVGRAADFAKIHGLRIDLSRVVVALAQEGIEAGCTQVDGQLVVLAVTSDTASVAGLCQEICGLPQVSMSVHACECLPRLNSGKLAASELHDMAEALMESKSKAIPDRAGIDVGDIYSRLLNREGVGPSDTFVSLGGDSLSYVAVSARLQCEIADLPRDWPHRSVADLQDLVLRSCRSSRRTLKSNGIQESRGSCESQVSASRSSRYTRGWRGLCEERLSGPRRPVSAQLETSIVLRALAIVAIVGSHIGAFDIRGGAHVLMVLAGYSLARFCLAGPVEANPIPRIFSGLRRIMVPALVWLALLVVFATEYGPSLLLTNNIFGSNADSPEWRYWFIEALVYVLILVMCLLAVPGFRQLNARFPFAVPLATALVLFGLASVLTPSRDSPAGLYSPLAVGWIFVLGWAIWYARTVWQRSLLMGFVVLAGIPFFEDPRRLLVVSLSVFALIWLPNLRVPAFAAAPIAAVAGASLMIFLTHYQVYPLVGGSYWLGLLVALAVGWVVWRSWTFLAIWTARGVEGRVIPWLSTAMAHTSSSVGNRRQGRADGRLDGSANATDGALA